jgi:predicted DNA-binding transcriptional regulator AlpA
VNHPEPPTPDAETGKPPGRAAGDRLVTIADIRTLFGLGRTAAYELTHRPGFPEPVTISSRCYRWWASEVNAFAETLRTERPQQAVPQAKKPRLPDPVLPPRRITGTVRAARTSRQGS